MGIQKNAANIVGRMITKSWAKVKSFSLMNSGENTTTINRRGHLLGIKNRMGRLRDELMGIVMRTFDSDLILEKVLT